MKKSIKKSIRYSVALFLLVFFTGVWIPRLEYSSEKSRLSEDILISDGFRGQKIAEFNGGILELFVPLDHLNAGGP